MDINTSDNGKIAVIKTPTEFILKVNDKFFGPFANTQENVMLVYNTLKSVSNKNDTRCI